MYNDGKEHKVGDLVIVKKGFWEDEDSSVGMKAVISGTYASQYGGNDHESLRLTFEDGGSSSWWYASKLELVERDCLHLIDEWKSAAKVLADKHSDLDFIFANLEEVLENKYTASIQSVYSYLGGGSLWGAGGEGITYYQNSITVLMLLEMYKSLGDNLSAEGFKEFVKPYLKGETK